jgi:hypothetical protein
MFFREMILAGDLNRAVEVRTFGDISKENLQTYLEPFTRKAAFKEQVRRIGIIRDAENLPATAAQGATPTGEVALSIRVAVPENGA